ncbi:hypothetical protein C8J57DRAFT_1238468 [Mycena rebaudengoi]|nr:hypothetical protein C8J57DRAFT_1238468 [Mycena rebaudengoi]
MFNKLLSAAAFAALLLAQGAISAPQVLSPRSHKPCMSQRGDLLHSPTFPDAQQLQAYAQAAEGSSTELTQLEHRQLLGRGGVLLELPSDLSPFGFDDRPTSQTIHTSTGG